MSEQFELFKEYDPNHLFSVGEFNRAMRAAQESMAGRIMPAYSDGETPQHGPSNTQRVPFWAQIVGRGASGGYSWIESVEASPGIWTNPPWGRTGSASSSPGGGTDINPAWDPFMNPAIPVDGSAYVLLHYGVFDSVTEQNYIIQYSPAVFFAQPTGAAPDGCNRYPATVQLPSVNQSTGCVSWATGAAIKLVDANA